MNIQGEVLEGFICPICFQNLRSMVLLHDHFETAHSEEDRALLNHLKGLFGKAKKKILNQSDGEFSESAVQLRSVQSHTVNLITYEPQELGMTKRHTDYFKSVRGSRIDRFVIETNKIIVRLDKLLKIDETLEPSKRKALERDIVAWAPDSDVNLCMTCGRSFSILRRKHHCRLCGRIICNRCSHFLPLDFAKKITCPTFTFEGEMFHRSGSNSSLNSIMTSEGNLHMRMCEDCRFLLERREEQLHIQSHKPAIVQIYEKIREYMTDAEEMLPDYLNMAESLNRGETSFDLIQAHSMRGQLMKFYEGIVSLIKQIAALDTQSSQKSLRLQQMINAYACAFVQDNFLGLQKLPTHEEFVKLREQRRAEAQRRIAEERRIDMERKKLEDEILKKRQKKVAEEGRDFGRGNKSVGMRRSRSSEGNINEQKSTRVFSAKSPVTPMGGWKPLEVQREVADEKDPLLQQMDIIRSYIKQAQQDSRLDEVRMLKENLADLEKEFKRLFHDP